MKPPNLTNPPFSQTKPNKARRSMASSSPSRTPPCQNRIWTELPKDITAAILSRLGVIEILMSAQYVCVTWRNICKDPLMWRTIDMRHVPNIIYDLEKMYRHAIDLSCGNLVDINVEDIGNDELLKYIADSSSRIKRLRLVRCGDITDDGLSEVASKLPLLEDLEISYSCLSHASLRVVGASCPLLKSLKFNNRWYRRPPVESNDDAVAIAGRMHDLRHLQLFGNRLTNEGLRAILNCCPHLESLDLRQCFNLNLGEMGSCAERIGKLRLPDDSTDDYEFDAAITDYGPDDEVDDDLLYVSEYFSSY